MSKIVLLAMCFQLKQLKKQPKKNSGLNGTRVHIYDFHIFIFIYNHYHRAYDKLTINHLSIWLDSSVDRVLHRYRKVMASSPVQA